MSTGFYESDDALAQYLLFHYGTPEQIAHCYPKREWPVDFRFVA